MAGSRTLKLSILADVDDLKKKLDVGSKEVEGFGGKLEKFGKVAAAAFAAAAAAAAAYAGKLAIEGVKAAIEDEAAQRRLALALENVTGATNDQIAAVEQQILKTSLATGVADDKLRPALQRLATATGSVERSQELLALALDISAATGKDVETVSNALSKAYEGNTSSLSRLGIGLSTTEIKTLGLEGTVKQLAQTFGGAAATQANTFEGQIKRLQVSFDEAKESVGAALLPILQSFLNYVVNTLIPKLQEAKRLAIDPVVQAFRDNEEALRDLWAFTKNYIIPIFENGLVASIKAVGTAVAGIVNIIGTVVTKIKDLVNDAINAINAVIRAYNAIPILPNVSTIPNVATGGGGVGLGGRPLGGGAGGTGTGSGSSSGAGSGSGAGTGISTSGSATGIGTGSALATSFGTDSIPKSTGSTFLAGAFDTFGANTLSLAGINAASNQAFAFGTSGVNTNTLAGVLAASGVTINVNSPSIIDEEGFTRAVVLALNNSTNRGTTGAGDLRTTAQIL
jgi:hypothetical protein